MNFNWWCLYFVLYFVWLLDQPIPMRRKRKQ